MSTRRKNDHPELYEIKVKGYLEGHWAEWFEELNLNHESDGTTILYGPLADQAALHSVLRKIRDLNLQLIFSYEVLSNT